MSPSPEEEPEEELEVTSATTWRSAKQVGQIVKLPSGNVARVKRNMDLMELLKAGKIPNPLAATVEKMISEGDNKIDPQTNDPEAVMAMLEFIDQNVARAMVEPRCELPPKPKEEETADEYSRRLDEWQPSEGAISINEVDFDDRMFIFSFTQGLAADLETFRKAQESAISSVPNVPPVPVPAEPTSTH